MSKERELLKQVVENFAYVQDMHLIVAIQKLLNQPDINTQYLLDQVARLTAENAMLKEKWQEQKQKPVAWMDRTYGNLHEVNYGNSMPLYTAPQKREPLTSKLISLGNNCHESFIKGIRFAEKMHGIGGGE